MSITTRLPFHPSCIAVAVGVLFLAGGSGVSLFAQEKPTTPTMETPKPVVNAEEEFFDLPERKEARGGLFGKDADTTPPVTPPRGENPSAKGQVVLSEGSVSRVGARTVFKVKYRVEGVLPPGRYSWVIVPARGFTGFKQNLTPLQLRGQGTLEGQAIGAPPFGPYRTYVVVERLVPGSGLREEKISEVFMFR